MPEEEYYVYTLQPDFTYKVYNNFGSVSISSAKRDEAFKLFNLIAFKIASLEGIKSTATGDTIIPPYFDACTHLYNRFWVVQKNGKSGIWSEKNGLVVDTVYTSLQRYNAFWLFKNDTGSVRFLGKSITRKKITKSFQVSRNYQFGYIHLFEANQKYGVINASNETLIEPNFDKITHSYAEKFKINDGLLLCYNNDSTTIMNMRGKPVNNLQYKVVKPLSKTVFIVEVNQDFFIYNQVRNELKSDYPFQRYDNPKHSAYRLINLKNSKVGLLKLGDENQCDLIYPFDHQDLKIVSGT